MLTKMQLTNFKSWASTKEVRLAPITAFFGANSSGKTSLLQALLLLKQTTDSSDRGLVLHFGDKNSPVNLGDFRSAIFNHDIGSSMELSLDWKRDDPIAVRDPQTQDQDVVSGSVLGFTTKVKGVSRTASSIDLTVQRLEYRVGGAQFGMEENADPKKGHTLFATGTSFEFNRNVGRAWPLLPPVRCYGFPDQVRAYYQNAGFLSDLELALEDRLRRLYYLGPLRAYPERQYTWAGAQPSDMGRTGEDAVKAILYSRERGEKIQRAKGGKNRRVTLEEYIAEWLLKLGLIDEFRVEAVKEGSQIFQVQVKKSTKGTGALITDVGFGVSQILPVLVLCFYVPEGSTIILEQPEIHLHPAIQAGLADVFIDAYRKRKVQVLIESHSEYLLRRLQRRMAEEKLKVDEAAVYFCEAGDQGSTLRQLDLDMFGTIKNWPKDFFGDAFDEIAATQEAALKRKIENKQK